MGVWQVGSVRQGHWAPRTNNLRKVCKIITDYFGCYLQDVRIEIYIAYFDIFVKDLPIFLIFIFKISKKQPKLFLNSYFNYNKYTLLYTS